tara:strand:- start:63 stop:443 length:381 start_codon:yes stop_codon:yes gene_type:complete
VAAVPGNRGGGFFIMASITTSQLSDDLDHALDDFAVTLTTVLPTTSTGTTFAASRQNITNAFVIEENGRETQIDARFHININGVSTYPSKGWVLNDGSTDLKVLSTSKDPGSVALEIDVIARHANG